MIQVIKRFLQRIIPGFITFFLIITMSSSLIAQDTPMINTAGNAVDGFPVTLGEQTLFRVREGVPNVATAEERAQIISDRLLAVAENSDISLDDIQATSADETDVIQVGDTVLLTILESDRKAAVAALGEGEVSLNRDEIRTRVLEETRRAIQMYRDARSLKSLIRGGVIAVVSTLVTVVLLRLLLFVSNRSIIRIHRLGARQALKSRWRILSSRLTSQLLIRLIRLIRLVLIFSILYVYLPFFLRQFPLTKPLGDRILSNILSRLGGFATGFTNYIPNLITLCLLGLLTYYLLEWIEQVVAELGQEDAHPWFYPEWIIPTNRLATLLMIAIACVIGAPYLPGFGSPAFQGVSIFLGALVTLGSSSAVSNAVAGIILIYTRAFQLQDVVRVDDVFGQVSEKSLFVTRIVTPKQETITVPNSKILNSDVTNYSEIVRQPNRYLLLHTTITLGYDVPWRKIDEVLVQAALATPQIIPDPSPFVLQTSLNDFNVSYELNAYIQCPELMAKIYSDLHQNIQDFCNRAEIEILSPTYFSLRDGNHSTIPEDYLPEDYESASFRISTQEH